VFGPRHSQQLFQWEWMAVCLCVCVTPEGLKDMSTIVETARVELQNFLRTGDGMRCPEWGRCEWAAGGGWCLESSKVYVERLLSILMSTPEEFASIGPVTGCRALQLVESVAESLLETAGVQHAPVSSLIAKYADEQCPVEVRVLPLMRRRGAVWRLKDAWVIQLRAADLFYVRRFILFHEIFHVLVDDYSCLPCRRVINAPVSFNEVLADLFASYALVPTDLLERHWQGAGFSHLLARLFDVPDQVVCIRLRQVGLAL